jgi:hypothetical protein
MSPLKEKKQGSSLPAGRQGFKDSRVQGKAIQAKEERKSKD